MGDAGDIAKGQAADARRFAAFISYSHADADAAAKLQRRLESYRLPKRIAEARLNAASSLGSIFRDREDLAAAASLSAAIRDAIGRAEALIVLCSPEAAASPWVGAEIELFRELHPDKPILAALLYGEPAISFPAALTANGNEPLAADLRAEGDGEQLGFLKIVAGIAGVPLDALIQRDAQRRIRRVTAITAVALAAMLIMGIMTTLALQARNEAARQRVAAEGLVEYMLTDLREKLEGVGKLDVMRGVNRRALDYYTSQANLTSLGSESLLRRARVIEAMGRDDENAGNLETAYRRFLELDRTTSELLQRDPSNEDLIFRKAESINRLALTAHSLGRKADAVKGFSKSELTLSPLLKKPLVKTEWLRLAALIHGNICASMAGTREMLDIAVRYCTHAITWSRELIMREPAQTRAQYDLVFHYVWLADAYAKKGSAGKSAQADADALALIDGLKAREPENMLLLEQEMQVHGQIAARTDNVEQPKKRIAHLERAARISKTLFAREPKNAAWRRYYEIYHGEK